MRAFGCAREPEILAALRAGRSPGERDDELHAHLRACEDCRELLEVASAVLEDHDVRAADATLPGSGLVWWRMQARVRQETARSAMRTLLLVQVFSVSIAGGVALATLQVLLPDWSSRLAGLLPAAMQGGAAILLALVVWLALAGAPLAAYLATREEEGP